MKRNNLLLVVVLIMGFSALLMAQPGVGGPMGNAPEPGIMPHLEKMLDLSDEQAAKIADMRLQLQKEMLPLRSDLVQKRNELKLLITADKPDQARINKTIGAISGIRQQMQEKRVEQTLKIRALLTDAQKKQFDAMILNGRKGGVRGPREMRGSRHGMEGPPRHW